MLFIGLLSMAIKHIYGSAPVLQTYTPETGAPGCSNGICQSDRVSRFMTSRIASSGAA